MPGYSSRTRPALRRRLRSLAAGELASCVALPAAGFVGLGLPTTPANAAGMAVLVVLLVQGAAYWMLKHRQLARPRGDRDWVATYAVLRVADPILLAAAGVVIGWQLAAAPPSHALLGLAAWILAALEYVNYFHRQLAYGGAVERARLRRGGLTRSTLARDIAARRVRRKAVGAASRSTA